MGSKDRLDRLEASLPPEQCPKCHDKQFAVYVKDSPTPTPCPKCGKTPPFVIQANSTACQDMVLRVLAGERTERGKEEKHEDQSS